MTTPVYANTFGWVLQQAFEAVGLVAEGQSLTSSQIQRGMNKLNEVVAFQLTKGLKLFTIQDVPITLTAGLNSYPLGPGQSGASIVPKPERIDFAYFLGANTSDRVPLTAASQQEWTLLPSPSQGTPVNYFVDKQTTYLGLYVWPTPDATSATGKLHIILRKALVQGELYTQATGFPPEWFLPLMWSLAAEISIGQPIPIIQMAQAKAEQYMKAVEDWDVEDAETFFTPDSRGTYGYGSQFY